MGLYILPQRRTRVLMLAVGCLVAALAAGPAGAAGNRTLVMTIEPFAPFAGPELPRNGFLTVLTKAAFKAGGYHAVAQFLPWKRAQLEVQQGDRDALYGLYYTKERAKHYWYTDPVYKTRVGFMALDHFNIKTYDSLHDLAGYSIGVGRGYANGPKFEAANYLDKEFVKDTATNVRKLYNERLDLVVDSFDRMRSQTREEGYDPSRLFYLSPPLKSHGMHVGISRTLKDGKQIRDAFNRGLRKIHANGEYDKILHEYDIND